MCVIEKGLILRSGLALLLLATPSIGQSEELAQKEEPAVQLRAELVLVPVQVLDRKGRPVGGLLKEDFVLFEDGVPQQISFFGHDEIPLSVLLLIETFHRPEIWHFEEISKAAHAILSRLGPEDQVALMKFDGQPSLIQEFTGDKSVVLQRLEQLVEGPLENEEDGLYVGSLLYTATTEAARYVLEATERKRRRAIIVFTYNIGEALPPRPFTGDPEVASKRRMEREELERRLLQLLYRSDIVVCGVIIGYARMRFLWGLMVRNEAKVDKLVKVTGGWMITAKPQRPVKVDQIAQLIDNLRAQYVLGYVPANAARDGKFRKIKIELSPAAKKKYKDVQLRYRQGYIAASGREGEPK